MQGLWNYGEFAYLCKELNGEITMIRPANKNDIKRIIELLHQVNMVHHVLRPDLFKPYTPK